MTNEELVTSMALIADYYWEAVEESPDDVININWMTLNRLMSVFKEYADVTEMKL